jgi:hypothetical protein
MDEATAKLITAMTTGQSAATAALIALLVQKGVITIDEVTSMLESYERELDASDLPGSATPVRTVIEVVRRHFAESLQTPRPGAH